MAASDTAGHVAAGSDDGPEMLTAFEATDAEGFLAFDTETPEEDALEFGGVEGESIELEGIIFSDWSWESTYVELPPIDLESLIEEVVDVPSWAYNVEVEMLVEEPIQGTYNPESGFVTADLDVTIEGTAKDPVFGIVEIDAEVEIDAMLTSGASGEMTGEVDGLATASPSMRVVANDYYVAETESTIVNEAVGLPALSGRNWVELDLALAVDDPEALEELIIDPVVGDSPPADLDNDGLHEDVAGTGEFSTVDVMALFENLQSAPVQEQAELFLFAGGDRNEVRIADVQALYHGLATGGVDDPPDTVVPIDTIDISLQAGMDELPVDETTAVDVVVEGPTEGIGAFDFAVSLSDDNPATITGFEHGSAVVADGTHMADDGAQLVLEGAMLEEALDGSDAVTLATLSIEGDNTGTVDVDPVVDPFPRGVFDPGSGWYSVDTHSGETLAVVPPITADVDLESQESTGETVVVTEVDPGNHGEFVGIWTVADGDPAELRGLASVSGPAQDVAVDLDEPLASDTTLTAAVHPGDDGDADTGEMLATDTATVEVPPTAGTLAGTVTGGDDPLAEVEVAVLTRDTGETISTATTDAAGEYEQSVDAGIYEVAVDPAGFQSASDIVAIAVEETSVADFDLPGEPQGPPPLPGFENAPQDLDGDGYYEDIDGNGTFDIFDVQALFSNLQSPEVQEHTSAFDFDGDGSVTVFDVQQLYDRL